MQNPLRASVVEAVGQALERMGVQGFDVDGIVEVPPKPELGDYAFPCFQLAKVLRRAPAAIAADLAAQVQEHPAIRSVEVVNAYVNFFLDPAYAAEAVIGEVLARGEAVGSSAEGAGKTVVIDYSSPNIAKPFHVGHLRSTIIGHSLGRIFESLGYRVVRLNHLGDWGTQFGKLIVAYRRWGDPQKIAREPISELLSLYVRFHEEAEKDPSLEDEARAAFKRLEEGGEEERSLWQEFRRLSLEEFEEHYRRLGVTFDSYAGESAYNERMEQVVDELERLGLLTESEGARVVELEGLPPCLIKKKDGATLYATRDLAAAIHRFETYQFDHLFYVVGAPQQLHFQQVFGVLRRMGREWVGRCEHIAFGHIRFADGQLSTRRGNVVFLKDVLDEAVRRVRAIVEERNPGLEGKDRVAEEVGIGAVLFNDLSHNRIKDITFDWETALNFDGDTGPYVQYTHARAASLLRRAEQELGIATDRLVPKGEELVEPETFRLVKALAEFPEAVRRAAEAREPSEVARYLLALCREFNSFYHAHRIVQSDAAASRLALAKAVKYVVARGLFLLGIAAPDAM